MVAFKRLSLQSEGPNADPDSSEIGVPLATIREISLLKVIEHENLARYGARDSVNLTHSAVLRC